MAGEYVSYIPIEAKTPIPHKTEKPQSAPKDYLEGFKWTKSLRNTSIHEAKHALVGMQKFTIKEISVERSGDVLGYVRYGQIYSVSDFAIAAAASSVAHESYIPSGTVSDHWQIDQISSMGGPTKSEAIAKAHAALSQYPSELIERVAMRVAQKGKASGFEFNMIVREEQHFLDFKKTGIPKSITVEMPQPEKKKTKEIDYETKVVTTASGVRFIYFVDGQEQPDKEKFMCKVCRQVNSHAIWCVQAAATRTKGEDTGETQIVGKSGNIFSPPLVKAA